MVDELARPVVAVTIAAVAGAEVVKAVAAVVVDRTFCMSDFTSSSNFLFKIKALEIGALVEIIKRTLL